MIRVTFDQFLERAVVYERMPIQVTPRLRRCAWLCWPVITVSSLIFYFLPDGEILRDSPFFFWTRGWMTNIWNFLAANRSFLLYISLAVLGLALTLFVLTRAYHHAEIGLHAAMFVPVVYASASLLFVLFLLLPVLANLIVWFIVIALAAAICVFFIAMAVRVGER